MYQISIKKTFIIPCVADYDKFSILNSKNKTKILNSLKINPNDFLNSNSIPSREYWISNSSLFISDAVVHSNRSVLSSLETLNDNNSTVKTSLEATKKGLDVKASHTEEVLESLLNHYWRQL